MPILLRLRNLGNGKRKIFVFGAIGVAGKAKIIKFCKDSEFYGFQSQL
jgi:hypothetical protein